MSLDLSVKKVAQYTQVSIIHTIILLFTFKLFFVGGSFVKKSKTNAK